jgi:hypothetical protein
MNAPQPTPFDELLSQYSAQARQPVPVPSGFADRVAKARQAEVARLAVLKWVGAGVALVVVVLMSVLFLQPEKMNAVEGRAMRKVIEQPYRTSEWNVDVSKLTIPTKGLFASMPKVTLPETPALPKLGGVSQAAANSLDPLTSGPRRTLTLFLRDTGFGQH